MEPGDDAESRVEHVTPATWEQRRTPARLLSPTPRKRKRRRHFASWHEDWSQKNLGTLVMGALLIGAPQLLGGALPWTINAIAALSLLCLVVVAMRAPALGRSAPRMGLMLLIMAGWTALQAAPLPCELVAWLSPDSAEKQRAINAIMDMPAVATCTLSQDPGNTQQELIKGLSLTATFIAAWAFAASGGWRRLFFLIASSSLAMSVVALAHWVLDLDRVFGLYRPVGMTRVWLLAPLMNSNNLGAFAALGAPLWIGLSFREPHTRLRLMGYAALVITSTTSLLSLSRGAIGQLIASYVVMGLVILRRSRGSSRAKERAAAGLPTRALTLVVSTALGLGLGAYLVGDEALHEFKSGRMEKLDLTIAALRFAGQHALVGVGRGAFGSAFVSAEGALARYRFAENFVAQWAAEWGIPMTLALLGFIAWELVTAARARESLARAGAITALCLYGAQNLVDFAFELLGVATVAVALLGGCIAPSSESLARDDRAARQSQRRGAQLALATLCAGIAALAFLGPRLGAQSVPALTAALRQRMASSDRAAFKAKAHEALVLHPSEPVLTLLIASEALAHDDPKTLAWLNRSMQLAPKWARPHQLAFRWLWKRGRGRQALLELKLATAIDNRIALHDVCRLGQVNADWALAVAPHNAQRAAFMSAVSICLAASPTSRAFDEAVLREYPNALHALMHKAARLRRQGRIDDALALLDRAQQAHPGDYRPSLERLQTLSAAGRLDELLDAADTVVPRFDAQAKIAMLAVKALALARAGSSELALQSVHDVRRLSGTDPTRLAESYSLEARVHVALHEPGAALTAYREAYRINDDTRILWDIAGISESLGDRGQALWAYVNLCEREPRGGGCERRNALLTPPTDNSSR